MTLRVAIQMDHPSLLSAKGDSTVVLALEAQKRNAQLFYYHANDIQWCDGAVSAPLQPLVVKDPATVGAGDWYQLGEAVQTDLLDVDVVLMRQDPPFDDHYITATHLLERVHPQTLVANDPFHVRNAPEKILPFDFAEFMPETLVTSNNDALRGFLETHGDIVIKPLYGYGGYSVYRLREGGDNNESLLEMLRENGNIPMVAQRFLPEVSDGDRRIILIDGKVEGVLGRIPPVGEIRANLRAGGSGAEAILTPRQREICEAIGPVLREKGLLFVGLDTIGDWLTEINVTSPTGLRSVKDLYGTSPEVAFWDAIEKRL